MMSLTGLPMPPSINGAFVNLPGRGRCKSRIYLDFEVSFRRWAIINRQARSRLQPKPNYPLKLILVFRLHRSRIFSKKGEIKRFDISNRIKVIEDKICEFLDIDDSIFWKVSAEKVEIPADTLEGVDVIIDQMDP